MWVRSGWARRERALRRGPEDVSLPVLVSHGLQLLTPFVLRDLLLTLFLDRTHQSPVLVESSALRSCKVSPRGSNPTK